MAGSHHERSEEERRRLREWMAALDEVLDREGAPAAERLLRQLQRRAATAGVQLPFEATTPYVNTISAARQPDYPGDLEMDRRIEGLTRWNAMAMVHRGNARLPGIGGHISSYASAGALFELGLSHFFRGGDHPEGPDLVFFQGHASPGVYARAFLEGRLEEAHLDGFRREVTVEGGLSSYPHPWLMPRFWEVPSVSMGLAPMMATRQARFDRYLQSRGLIEHTGRVWAVVGDGEMDEPESVGGLAQAADEGLSNLTFVVDCNLQRLDGPVRGNGNVIQELEARFRGAGWHVIKVIWGSRWDPLLEADADGLLVERMGEALDGDYQRYAVQGGAHFREHFFGADPALLAMVEGRSDADLEELEKDRGGHDLRKLHAAYRAAEEESERPTVILAKTIKGWGLGPAGEAQNVAHKTKKLDLDALRAFRDLLGVPIGDDYLEQAPYYRPAEDSPERKYLAERREALGGPIPRRRVTAPPLEMPEDSLFERHREGTGEREATTTVLLVRLLGDLLDDDDLGKLIVPIIPDEARTFGVESLFPKIGIYSPAGQRYTPVDEEALLTYREAKDGQLLEEGISEAAAIGSTIAAGTAYARHGLNTVPFYFFYSMFGFQRIGDLIWAAEDSRARGFLIGATSGRTTLNGEGLQHQDGHSHLIAMGHPTIHAYDPAFGYEVATIVEDGLRRMYTDGEPGLWYLTVANEPYAHPTMPQGAPEGILRGLYRLRASDKGGEVRRAQLLASGPMVRIALEAQRMLEEDYDVTADVWSATSWKELYVDAIRAERRARLASEEGGEEPWIRRCLGDDPGTVVAVSDFVKAVPGLLGRFLDHNPVVLGTDGFGRSDSRQALRDFFEVDARHVAHAALWGLARDGRIPMGTARRAAEELGIDPEAPDPIIS